MTKDVKINTDVGNFIFCPTFTIKDKNDKPILYLLFNLKSRLALFHINEHQESKHAAEKFKKEFTCITKKYGDNWLVSNIIDYIKDIKDLKDLKGGDRLANVGIMEIRKIIT